MSAGVGLKPDLQIPDAPWVAALREEVSRSTVTATAKVIGYSPAVVSQVLAGCYRGDLRRVESAVSGALMGATVDCPVVGELPRNRCVEYQRRAGDFAATNPLRVALSRACARCPNRE